MKKKVLAQINALAQRIIVSENIDIAKTKNTLIQLYEKLSVLEFLETSVETEFKKPERSAIDSKTYREENWFEDPDPVPQPTHEDSLVEPLMEKIKDIVAQMPSEAQKVDELLKEILPEQPKEKNELEEFAAEYQEMPVFERVSSENKNESESFPESKSSSTEKPKSLNDKLNQGINIGLNDRLAFIKHLFEGSGDDFTRVLSQINSMATYTEVTSFIEKNVKSDYNNWNGKEEYADRFLLIIEKRFN